MMVRLESISLPLHLHWGLVQKCKQQCPQNRSLRCHWKYVWCLQSKFYLFSCIEFKQLFIFNIFFWADTSWQSLTKISRTKEDPAKWSPTRRMIRKNVRQRFPSKTKRVWACRWTGGAWTFNHTFWSSYGNFILRVEAGALAVAAKFRRASLFDFIQSFFRHLPDLNPALQSPSGI